MFELLKKFFRKIDSTSVDYIVPASGTLPDKPTTAEEKSLVEQLSLGDSGAREELIERNLRLVVYTAQKFESTGACIEDLISVGTIGLIKAVGSFKGDKNIKMATYASRCIENEILMYLRKLAKTKHDVSLDEPLNTDSEGNELSIADVLGTDCDFLSRDVETQDEQSVVREVMADLPAREREIVDMRYGFSSGAEMTQKEVADKLNISQSYISRIEKKILFRLKKEIECLA
jgi:RNA polymerase sporulation-specific sigma factor